MRLRPSGNAGPIATSLASFRRYYAEAAWTWEHLALTRARPVAGQPYICACVEGELRAIRRSEEHTSELQSLMRISYAVFCLKKKRKHMRIDTNTTKVHDLN